MRKIFIALVLVLGLIVTASIASASPVFVGTFETDQGLWWTDNPPVYSAREGAALVFGGNYTDYLISTNPDPNIITDTGWYSIIGIGGGWEYAQDFKQDLGAPGYGGLGWVSYDDISAYVGDNAEGAQFTMYVYKANSVPEPATMLLFGLGLVGLAGARRKFKK